mgnify:CR=1 FL=1
MPKTDAPVDIMKCLPDYWTEDDKLDYQMLTADAKKYFPKMEDFIIHIGVMAYINDVKKGMRVPATEEQVKETMKKYDNESTIIYTPYDINSKSIYNNFFSKQTIKIGPVSRLSYQINNTIINNIKYNNSIEGCSKKINANMYEYKISKYNFYCIYRYK